MKNSIAFSMIFFVCMLFAFAGSAYAQIYRWEDAQGNVGYADTLNGVPEEYRSTAKLIGDEDLPELKREKSQDIKQLEQKINKLKATNEMKEQGATKTWYIWMFGATVFILLILVIFIFIKMKKRRQIL